MKKISFTKMNGAGNDFILIDGNKYNLLELIPAAIKKICDRRFGIGSDGLIIVKSNDKYDFEMQYFNSDGSTGSLCGNGARCAIKYAFDKKLLKNNFASFISNNIEYKGEIVDEESVKFCFNFLKKLKYNLRLNANGQMINSYFVDTGSPHVVIKTNQILKDQFNPNHFCKSIDEIDVERIGKEIRWLNDFSPSGTNVNFIQIDGEKILIRTYERGVESETLACGTGSVAAAIICYAVDSIPPPVKIVTKGGYELIVNFIVQNKRIKNITLTGPAKVNFAGEFLYKNFFN